MLKLHYWIKDTILAVVDFFYPPFKNIMPLQTFRYAACGGGNMALNLLIYTITYNFILEKQIVYTPITALKPHVASLIVAFCFTFPIGFYLSMFVVFPESYLRKRIQLFRYFVIAIICILLNYYLLLFFVDKLGWYPTPSLAVITVIVVTFSYLSQRHFSFKKE